jgi:hypothetical protein
MEKLMQIWMSRWKKNEKEMKKVGREAGKIRSPPRKKKGKKMEKIRRGTWKNRQEDEKAEENLDEKMKKVGRETTLRENFEPHLSDSPWVHVTW